MKKALCLVMLLTACPLFAQQRQVRVRLFSTQLPSAVRIVPQRDAAIDGAPLKAATTISVQSGRIAIQQKPTATGAIRVTGTFVLEASDNPSVRLRQPLSIGIDGDRLRLVISEPLEDYVADVLAGEAGAFKSIESLKAMAVAIRTFAVRFEGDRHRGEGFDFCDTTHCQDFRIGGITDQLRSAVEATEGEILWFDGRPAATYYHQDCGGHTEAAGSVWPNARAPYLSSQQDPYCLAKGGTNWVADLTPEELRQATGATAVVVSSRTPSGRVQQLQLLGPKAARVTAEQFRLSIGRTLGWNRVRSDDYDIQKVGEKFQFHGHGAGHGVGLCQTGAAQMGESGRSYRDILAFYYPGTKLGITAQGLTWTRAGGERADVQTTRPDADRRLVTIGDRLVRRVEAEMGKSFSGRPTIRIFPSVPVFRDSTGEPGWVAASTRDMTIRMQPLETLGPDLERTLHHELAHVIIDQNASANVPRWFREGLALVVTYSSSGSKQTAANRNSAEIEQALLRPKTREDFFQAYANAEALVGQAILKYGRATVLSWLRTGLPPNATSSQR